jgi:hypothetical protein
MSAKPSPLRDNASEMKAPACPYLTRETTACRSSLDLSAPAEYEVISTWFCRHPFHGIRLELGDALVDVERHCAACSLPAARNRRR